MPILQNVLCCRLQPHLFSEFSAAKSETGVSHTSVHAGKRKRKRLKTSEHLSESDNDYQGILIQTNPFLIQKMLNIQVYIAKTFRFLRVRPYQPSNSLNGNMNQVLFIVISNKDTRITTP